MSEPIVTGYMYMHMSVAGTIAAKHFGSPFTFT